VVWLRERFTWAVPERWGVLVECPWCVAPYLTLLDLIWAWTTGLHWSWWAANTWAAVSWLAAYLCMRDVPPDKRE
jgi:hypothetical protein